MAQESNSPRKSPLFSEERTFEPQKVEWMDVLYPRVNGPEYRAFRKAHDNLTHHDYTASNVAGALAGKPFSRDEAINHMRKHFINRGWKDGEIDIQVAQFLGQLTLKGWNGLLNHIQKIVEGKAQ